MWRSVLAFILVPSLVWSQNLPVPSDDPQGSTLPAEVPAPNYQALTQMQSIRRGTTERAAIMFTIANELVASPRDRGGKVVPLKLEFAPDEGITLSHFEFPPDDSAPFRLQNEPIRRAWANMAIHFRVKASRGATLGERILKGKLTYQIVRNNEALAPQSLDLQLPLNVVEHDSANSKNPEYTQNFGDPGGDHHVLMWILSPILIPAVAFAVIFCLAARIDCFD